MSSSDQMIVWCVVNIIFAIFIVVKIIRSIILARRSRLATTTSIRTSTNASTTNNNVNNLSPEEVMHRKQLILSSIIHKVRDSYYE